MLVFFLTLPACEKESRNSQNIPIKDFKQSSTGAKISRPYVEKMLEILGAETVQIAKLKQEKDKCIDENKKIFNSSREQCYIAPESAEKIKDLATSKHPENLEVIAFITEQLGITLDFNKGNLDSLLKVKTKVGAKNFRIVLNNFDYNQKEDAAKKLFTEFKDSDRQKLFEIFTPSVIVGNEVYSRENLVKKILFSDLQNSDEVKLNNALQPYDKKLTSTFAIDQNGKMVSVSRLIEDRINREDRGFLFDFYVEYSENYDYVFTMKEPKNLQAKKKYLVIYVYYALIEQKLGLSSIYGEKEVRKGLAGISLSEINTITKQSFSKKSAAEIDVISGVVMLAKKYNEWKEQSMAIKKKFDDTFGKVLSLERYATDLYNEEERKQGRIIIKNNAGQRAWLIFTQGIMFGTENNAKQVSIVLLNNSLKNDEYFSKFEEVKTYLNFAEQGYKLFDTDDKFSQIKISLNDILAEVNRIKARP